MVWNKIQTGEDTRISTRCEFSDSYFRGMLKLLSSVNISYVMFKEVSEELKKILL
jgi:hypothetical protein